MWALLYSVLYLIMASHADQPKETCTRRRVALIVRKENCRPTKLLTYGCAGQCRSYTMVQGGFAPHVERHCQCCQEMGYADHRIPLLCRDASNKRPVMAMTIVRYPTSCLCRPCGAGDITTPLEILEYVAAKRLIPTKRIDNHNTQSDNAYIDSDNYVKRSSITNTVSMLTQEGTLNDSSGDSTNKELANEVMAAVDEYLDHSLNEEYGVD